MKNHIKLISLILVPDRADADIAAAFTVLVMMLLQRLTFIIKFITMNFTQVVQYAECRGKDRHEVTYMPFNFISECHLPFQSPKGILYHSLSSTHMRGSGTKFD